MKKAKNNYVDNKKLYAEMVIHTKNVNEARKTNLPRGEWPKVSNYIGECIYLIATNLSHRPNFSSYSFREEMICDGIENCLMYLHNFNPDKYKSPFTYFTTIIYYAFIRRIQKEQKQQYIKYKSLINSSVMNTLVVAAEDAPHFNSVLMQMDNDKAISLTEKFEPKRIEKKHKIKGVEKFLEQNDLDGKLE